MERQVTHDPYGHILTNIGCWSADGEWLVYDTRSDVAGSQFDGRWIERVHVASGRVERLYESGNGACCGVVTCCPVSDRIVFILGPEHPTLDWQYAAYHRRGVILVPGQRDPIAMDAMCYAEPLVPGALRGGSHVHTFDGTGQYLAYTYEDHLLATHPAHKERAERAAKEGEVDRDRAQRNQRNVAVSVSGRSVQVPKSHPRNHDGTHFSVVVTRTSDRPEPGSDQIDRAYEDAWVGTRGYEIGLRGESAEERRVTGGKRQKALAFLGDLVTAKGQRITELFLVDLPDDLTIAGDDGPLEGTAGTRPCPPLGTQQRRLTYTSDHPYPGVFGARHWPRSLPDGSRIYFLMRDRSGVVQIWGIAPSGGPPEQLTQVAGGVSSAFSVSSNGQLIAFIADDIVWVTETSTGRSRPLTQPSTNRQSTLRGEACVFSPNGRQVAYVRSLLSDTRPINQIFVATVE